MFNPNPLYYSDGYKPGHKWMLAPGTEFLYGTWIPRSGKYAPKGVTKVMSIGQQLTWMWINDQYNDNFFSKPLDKAMKFVEDMNLYLGLPYDGEHFAQLHEVGYLPMHVKSLPEGIETPFGIPHQTFINTISGFAWLSLYLETIISSLSWKMATSATIAKQYHRNTTKAVEETDPENSWLIPFMCHDFSARGLDPFSTITSGLGHASSFRGSDSLITIPAARYFYGEPDNEVIINSVNASEHSVSTTKIFTVGEQQMLTDWMTLAPNGILSVVADTFDLWVLVMVYLVALKDQIMSRNGKLVIRPDSGDPVNIICGLVRIPDDKELDFWTIDSYTEFIYKGDVYSYDLDEYISDRNEYGVNSELELDDYLTKLRPEEGKDKGLIELLWDIFGGTTTSKGYKLLDSHIGAIYGDSINLERQVEIYQRLADKDFAATNIVLGVGSFTYQFNTRDTLGFAAKGGWFVENGSAHNIYKDPVTDDGTKKSPKGLLRVDKIMEVDETGKKVFKEYVLKDQCTVDEEKSGMLETIFVNGSFTNLTTFIQIRDRISKL